MRIAISPDENPGQSGSVAADGTTERSVNLLVAGALRDALVRCGQDAWFDPTITWDERVATANGDGTALLVATAHNESTDGQSGTQFVFCPGGLTFGHQSAAAAAVYGELAKLPGWPARRGDAVENVVECCAFNGDTVYCELLYMSPQDEPLWSAPGYPRRAAEAIARGLASTYGFAYVAPPQLEEPVTLTNSRPDGQTDKYTLIDGEVLHAVLAPVTGNVTHQDTLPGEWRAIIDSGYAWVLGYGMDGKLYAVRNQGAGWTLAAA